MKCSDIMCRTIELPFWNYEVVLVNAYLDLCRGITEKRLNCSQPARKQTEESPVAVVVLHM